MRRSGVRWFNQWKKPVRNPTRFWERQCDCLLCRTDNPAERMQT